jgi:hypothetical protein
MAKEEHNDECETGEHKGGEDSMQHILHCMSQYNNGTLGTKGGAHVAGARPVAGAQLNGGANKGEGEL